MMDDSKIFSRNWTNDDLARMRENAVRAEREFQAMTGGDGSNPVLFTCDTCGLRWKCDFVFDLYNTDGDCLADK